MMKILVSALLALAIGAAALAEPLPLPPLSDYTGAEGCRSCHEKKYAGWKNTYHSTVVVDARKYPESVQGDFNQQGIGFSRDEVEFVIGGHWNQRYMKKIGDDYFILPKSWSLSSHRWEPYNVWGWKRQPYSVFCVGCHSTRYDPTDRSSVEHTIGCESCHGPGRAHAESEGKGPIIHPGKLGVEMEYICASCHVRGMDKSGQYHFAVNYVPGRDLTDYYVPGRTLEGESAGDAILREFRTWWGNLGDSNAECEVCGIPGTGEKKNGKPASKNDYCLGCHKFGDAIDRHTNHDSKIVSLECFDCHKKVEVEVEQEEDVHSVGYFLVHKRTCYDKNYAKACVGCHQNWSIDKAKEKLSTWSGRTTVHE